MKSANMFLITIMILICILIFIGLYKKQNNIPFWQNIQPNSQDTSLLNIDKFKYTNCYDFRTIDTSINELIKVDSMFHKIILKQIESFNYQYDPSLANYFYSISRNRYLFPYYFVTIKLYWDNCSEFLFGLVIDKNYSLKSSFPVSVWRISCGEHISIETYFTDKNVFRNKVISTKAIIDPVSGGEKWVSTSTQYLIKINKEGSLDTLKQKTLKQFEDN